MAPNSKDEQGVTTNGSASTSSASRKNRPLRRKTSHSVIERRRREKINEGLVSLQHLVPACRDELHELLLSKAQSNKRNLKRSKQEVEKEVEALFLQKIESQMVLEKLCIISHTVDYVRELQASLAAYRKMCRCSPPLADLQAAQDGSATEKTHGHVHMMDAEGDRRVIKAENGTSNNADGLDSSPEAEEDCIKCTISRAKRRRHWGSNHPLELAKVHSYDELAPDIKVEQPRRELPRRKAAPGLQSMREESIESASEEGEQSLHNAVNEESDEIIDGDSDDNGSDLALDDWQERRQSHADNGPITPPFPASVGYTHLYHTCSLRDERHKLDSPLQINSQSIQASKGRSLMNPTARSSSDGEQNHITHPLTFSRKRRATDVIPYDDVMQQEVKRSKSTDTKLSPSSEETLNNEKACTDCISGNAYVMGPKFGPNHRNAIREASPSDRLLHHPADANRLDLLANLVSRN